MNLYDMDAADQMKIGRVVMRAMTPPLSAVDVMRVSAIAVEQGWVKLIVHKDWQHGLYSNERQWAPTRPLEEVCLELQTILEMQRNHLDARENLAYPRFHGSGVGRLRERPTPVEDNEPYQYRARSGPIKAPYKVQK